MKEKILPIIDKSTKLPSFYAAKSLSAKDVKDIIRFYEYIFNPGTRNARSVRIETKQIGN
ncbi:MAG: hypothetical protein R6V47_02340 [Candidatus Delongbacteria bacterium]